MNLSEFRTYQIAVHFYHQVNGLRCSAHLKDQLSRASSSIVLNLAEGSGKDTTADQRRYFRIAMGSLRECQAVLDLSFQSNTPVAQLADKLGAHIFRLCHPAAK